MDDNCGRYHTFILLQWRWEFGSLLDEEETKQQNQVNWSFQAKVYKFDKPQPGPVTFKKINKSAFYKKKKKFIFWVIAILRFLYLMIQNNPFDPL